MWEYLIYQYGTQIMLVVIAVIFGSLGFLAKRIADKILTNDAICAAAQTGVLYAEQVCKDLHGEEKLDAAIQAGLEILESKGIHISAEQLRIYEEAALAEFNKAFDQA